MKRTAGHKHFLLVFIATAALACAGSDEGPGGGPGQPTEGHAYLTIVGAKNVFVDAGARQTIAVKYHDENGLPLAGEVTFKLQGDPKGSNLSKVSAVTDNEGLAKVDVLAGTEDAAYAIVAEAVYATPVNWNVAVKGQEQLKPLTVTGEYELESQFDIVSGLPGTVGTVVNTFIAMTDGPNDPATWLIDKALDNISSGTVKSIVNSLRPGLDAYVNSVIKSLAPGFVTTIIEVGDNFGQVAKKFGVVSTFKITQGGPDAQELRGEHTLTGVVFHVDGVRYEYTMAELSLPNVTANGLAVGLQGETRLTVGEHTLPFSYGAVMIFALNNVIIPAIDPWSHSLEELFLNNVDCYTIGWEIADYVGFGSPGLYEAACQTALATAAAYIQDQIKSIDSTATAFVIEGEAKPMDTNNDRTVDKLSGGLWEGVMKFGSLDSQLAKPNQKFVGERIGLP